MFWLRNKKIKFSLGTLLSTETVWIMILNWIYAVFYKRFGSYAHSTLIKLNMIV